MNRLATSKSSKSLLIRWTTLKGLTAIIIFLLIAIISEYLIVIYATNLGVKETSENTLQWTLQLPETDWSFTLAISPLFHLVPITVIAVLVFSWIYLTKQTSVKPMETSKVRYGFIGKRKESRIAKISKSIKNFFGSVSARLTKIKGFAVLSQRIRFAKATIKSALLVLFIFLAFILVFSLFTYPQLIYRAISNAYQNNPALLGFVKGSGEALAPVGVLFTVLSNALMSASPAFRDFAVSFGTVIAPLANLDDAGKYLVFQNVAAWTAALSALFYKEYSRKTRRYMRKG